MSSVRQQSAATFRVEISGRALPDDLLALMSYAVVEDNLNLPDSFFLSFLDPDRVVVGKSGVKIGDEVKIAVVSEVHPAGEPILSGEVTALEAEFDGGRTRTVIRGFDKANRLYRGRHTRAFKDVTYADVVQQVAQEAGLQIGRVDNPGGRALEHVGQVNATDAEFLTTLAGEVGFVLLVEDGKVNFHAPTDSATAPSEGDLDATDPLQLIQGDNLLRFAAVATSDSQVKEVTVRGWNIADKRELVGTTPAATTAAEVGVSPADLAATFGNQVFTAVDVPYGEQTQVEAAAGALAAQIAGVHAQLEGVARGNPKLKAGAAVSLGLVGEPFDGKYTLTVVRHEFDNGEYLTHFASTGRLERSLQSLTSGGGSATTVSPAFVTAPVPGVVSAIVTDTNDPEQMGRVRVKIPRLDDTFETGWLRVIQPGAGEKRGACVLPEVDDEVVVAFEHGDWRRGYVHGGVHNGRDTATHPAADGAVDNDGMVAKRSFTSRKGHYWVIDDTDGAEHLEVATKGAKYALRLAQDADGGAVLVTSRNLVKIDADGDITITGAANVKVEANGDLELKGRAIRATASSDIELSGLNVKVAASAGAEVTGMRTKVSGNTALQLEGGANATLRAAMVNIN